MLFTVGLIKKKVRIPGVDIVKVLKTLCSEISVASTPVE